MTKINNIIAYSRDVTITDEDYVIGSDGDTSNKETKNFFFNDIRSYLLAGLAPEVGGTLKVTEIAYTGVLTSPSEVANALDPIYNVLQYNIVIISVNGDKYLLGLQNISIGVDQTPITDNDFIILNANEKLGNGTNLYKGTNETTGKEEHYALKSVGLSFTKETVGPTETGNVLVEQTEQTTLGSGVKVYKQFNTTTKLQEFYTLASPSINIEIVGDQVVFTLPTNSDTPEFIVNSSYTGDDETGSLAQPFKDIPQALAAYVGGVGFTNKNPENIGAIIRVKKGVGYTFTGVFAHDELRIIFEEGCAVISNPSTGNNISDLDSDASLPFGMTPFGDAEPVKMYITLEENATITLQKKGHKNRGTNLNTSSGLGKSIYLLGKGQYLTSNEVSIVSPSTRSIIESNKENLAGFFNDGNVGNFYVDCNLTSYTTKIIEAGLNSKITLREGSSCQFGATGVSHNVNTVAYSFNGCLLDARDVEFSNFRPNADAPTNAIFQYNNTSNILIRNSNFEGFSVVNYFDCISDDNDITMTNNTHTVSSTLLFKSASGISTINLYNNFLNSSVDYSKISIFAPALNTIAFQLVESLNTYANKEVAITAGLFKGCKYIKRTLITAGSFVAGEDYQIVSIGSTDFTLIGASANTVGLIFTATGVGTGTGTANFDKLDIV